LPGLRGDRWRVVRLKKITVPYLPGQLCSVKGCPASAAVAVALVDRDASGDTFGVQDPSCPYLCHAHQRENEAGRKGIGPERRADDVFPYTNRHCLPGWVSYQPLSTAEPIRGRR
jgi:hypothetical protein